MNEIQLEPPLDYPIHRCLLSLLIEYRFATTGQLARATGEHYETSRSASRQTMRHLKNLENHGLTQRLERRIGGWQKGSAQSIWTTTSKGLRAVTGTRRRLRPEDLSTEFVAHHLAVTETRIVLQETAIADGFRVTIQGEPQCHRRYLSNYGQATWLKPDLHLWLQTPGQEPYAAFLEVDNATANPARAVEKCRQYHAAYQAGVEIQEHGFFPEVIWVVPHDKRTEQLSRYITAAEDLPEEMFTVATHQQLAQTIQQRARPNSPGTES